MSWKKEKKSGAPLFLLGSFRRRVVRASAREREKEERAIFFFRCWCSGSRRTLQFRVTGALEGASKFYALAYARMRELSYMTQYRALGGAREWRREEEREKWGVESEPKKKDRKKPTHRYDCRRFSRFFRDAPPAPSPTSSAPFKAAGRRKTLFRVRTTRKEKQNCRGTLSIFYESVQCHLRRRRSSRGLEQGKKNATTHVRERRRKKTSTSTTFGIFFKKKKRPAPLPGLCPGSGGGQ